MVGMMEKQQSPRCQFQQDSGSTRRREGAWKEKIFSTSGDKRWKIMEAVQNLFFLLQIRI